MISKLLQGRGRILLFVFILIMFCTIDGLAATYFTEGFEGSWSSNAPPGWSYVNSGAYWLRDNGTGSGGYPYPSAPGSPHSGSYCAFFDAYDFYSGDYATMISPTINMAASTQGRLSFWFYRGSGYTSSIDVQISSNNGATWTTLRNVTGANTPWTQIFVAIPAAYWTSTVKVAFRANSDWWCSMWIDDVVVDDGSIPINYCIPGFYNYNLGSITNVTFGSINNTTPWSYTYPPYFDYSSSVPPASVGLNMTYDLSVTWTASTSYSANAYAFIDWNQNGTLDDPGEVYFVGSIYTSGGVPRTGTIPITIPPTATPGTTRMRIRVWNSGNPGPCGTQYGEVEDYSIKIIALAAPKIQLTPTRHTFAAESNMSILPAGQNLEIKNVGADKPMNWTATTSSTPAPNWLNVGPPTTGVLPGYNSAVTTVVQPNRTNLAATLPFTTYTGYVTVTSPDANNSPQQDTVTYNITPGPHINIGVANIIAKVLYKKPVVAKKIVVNNSGGMYNGGLMNWSVTTTTPWISFVGPTTGTQGGSFNLKVDPGANVPGTLTGSITISAMNSITGTPADNSPLVVPVTMEIEPDQNYTNTTNVTVPGNYYFNNSFNHRILDLTLNSGSLGLFTVNMFPGQVPNGLNRLRYVVCYFTFGTTVSPYNVNLGLYYTLSEMALGGVTKPEILTVWRQPITGGAWINMGGTSDPLNNRVTVNGIIDLSGNWVCASPWYPKRITLSDLKAICIGDRDVAIEWKSNLAMNEQGFIVQRAALNSDEWITVASVQSVLSGSYRIEDLNINKGTYQYQIIGIDKDGSELESQVAVLSVGEIPREFSLGQNYPNPFNPSTTISFGLPQNGNVKLEVYNLVGAMVASIIDGKELAAGNHTVSFNAGALESGTYIYRLTWNGYQLSKRLSIMR